MVEFYMEVHYICYVAFMKQTAKIMFWKSLALGILHANYFI
jgi:hypothetical protein